MWSGVMNAEGARHARQGGRGGDSAQSLEQVKWQYPNLPMSSMLPRPP